MLDSVFGGLGLLLRSHSLLLIVNITDAVDVPVLGDRLPIIRHLRAYTFAAIIAVFGDDLLDPPWH